MRVESRRSARQRRGSLATIVMAGLVPAIHDFFPCILKKDVDARHKAGHDEVTAMTTRAQPGSFRKRRIRETSASKATRKAFSLGALPANPTSIRKAPPTLATLAQPMTRSRQASGMA